MNLLGYIYRAIQIAPYQGVGTLTPPTLAPVLTVEADLGSNVANLNWTASNKTSSTGFGYAIWRQVDNASFENIDNVGPGVLSYNDDTTGVAPNIFRYYIIPFNAAGEGPSSNTVSINLPGESEAPVLTGPSSVESGDPTALLEWNAIPGATFYSVQRSPDDFTWTQIETPVGTSQSVTLTFSPSYYRVVPYHLLFEGLPSNSISITIVIPPAPDSYLRPDGTSTYLRPDGTSIYLRP